MRQRLLPLLFLLGVFARQSALAADTLTADQAKNHIGENATVCSVIASTRYAGGSRGTPTFVNPDKPYPNQLFKILLKARITPLWPTIRPELCSLLPTRSFGTARRAWKGLPD